MIISTGMTDMEEVQEAVKAVREEGCSELILLHCVSNYPADPADMNLKALHTLKSEFGVPVGLSDHTMGIEVALAAVALGACVIEKHFTLDRASKGPDHASSLIPVELKALVKGIRKVEAALAGDGTKKHAKSEEEIRWVARKSLVAARDIPKGSTLTEHFVTVKRPGTGLPPTELSELVGRTVLQDIPADTVLTREMVSS